MLSILSQKRNLSAFINENLSERLDSQSITMKLIVIAAMIAVALGDVEEAPEITGVAEAGYSIQLFSRSPKVEMARAVCNNNICIQACRSYGYFTGWCKQSACPGGWCTCTCI